MMTKLLLKKLFIKILEKLCLFNPLERMKKDNPLIENGGIYFNKIPLYKYKNV